METRLPVATTQAYSRGTNGLAEQVQETKIIINKILKDLDHILKNRTEKRLLRSRELIVYIVYSLRHRSEDHLLQTTAIWALINIFRTDPEKTRYTCIYICV
jgi:hypothetical protein